MSPARSAVDQVFALVGSDTDAELGHKARTFRRFFALVAVLHVWITEWGQHSGSQRVHLVSAALLSAALVPALLRPSLLRPFAWLLLATDLARIAVTFPITYNHLALETVFAFAQAITAADEPDEQQLLLQFVRACLVSVLFWTGLQKLLHGCYFDGGFLATMVAHDPRFADSLAVLFPDEVARIVALGPPRPGAGPYAFQSAPAIALSNSVWLLEMVAPLLLLSARTRPAGLLLVGGMLLAIELIARELVFGVLFTGSLMTFLPAKHYRTVAVGLGTLLVLALGVELLLPHWSWN